MNWTRVILQEYSSSSNHSGLCMLFVYCWQSVMWKLAEDIFKFTNDNKNRTSNSRQWRTHVTHCITANVLQTKLDAQCDKLATKLSWQRLWRSTFLSYWSKVACSNRPHLNLAPPLKVTQFSFAKIFGNRKLESLGYHVALFAWSYV